MQVTLKPRQDSTLGRIRSRSRQLARISSLIEIIVHATGPSLRSGFATGKSERGASLSWLLPPVDSMEPLWQDWERAAVQSKLGAAIVGSDAAVKAGLEKLVGDTRAEEVIAVTDTYDHADRLRSYQRVAGIATSIEVKPRVTVEA